MEDLSISNVEHNKDGPSRSEPTNAIAANSTSNPPEDVPRKETKVIDFITNSSIAHLLPSISQLMVSPFTLTML